jgi:hypothetical protein
VFERNYHCITHDLVRSVLAVAANGLGIPSQNGRLGIEFKDLWTRVTPSNASAVFRELSERLEEFDSAELSQLVQTEHALAIDRMMAERSSEGADDGLFTTAELAELAKVELKTLLNKLSQSRKDSDIARRPPEAAFKGGGNRQDSYSYSTIRTWLVEQWPKKHFPLTYLQACQSLPSG